MLIIQLVNVADLAAGMKLKIGEVGLQDYRIKEIRAHREILQASSVAYFRLSEIFVNGRDWRMEVKSYLVEKKTLAVIGVALNFAESGAGEPRLWKS